MKKKAAVLIDGGFALRKLKTAMKRNVTSQDISDFAFSCLAHDEELFRIFYYDCQPFGGKRRAPVSAKNVDFSATELYKSRMSLLQSLARRDHVAFRQGELSFEGWVLNRKAAEELIKEPRPITDDDFQPSLKQKRVDIMIGLDVAWLASKSIVDRVILVTADSDFIPAMKFARREGLQVVIMTFEYNKIKPVMFEHVDEKRKTQYPAKTPPTPNDSQDAGTQ